MKHFLISLVFIVLISACTDKSRSSQPKTKIVQPNSNSSLDRLWPAYLDKSPMDMIYFPPDYPILKMSGKTKKNPVARVIYSRPLKNGRKIFGNIVRYGTYWRLGANEATEIDLFSDVTITGKKVKKGRYTIYCIPFEDRWNIKLNGDLYVWGLRVNPDHDVYSFEIPVQSSDKEYEAFTMEFQTAGDEAHLVMAWDTVKAILPIKY